MVPTREVVNALLYLSKTDCQWPMLPHDFSTWQNIYDFKTWAANETLTLIKMALRETTRLDAGHAVESSAAILDSQCVKTGGAGRE